MGATNVAASAAATVNHGDAVGDEGRRPAGILLRRHISLRLVRISSATPPVMSKGSTETTAVGVAPKRLGCVPGKVCGRARTVSVPQSCRRKSPAGASCARETTQTSVTARTDWQSAGRREKARKRAVVPGWKAWASLRIRSRPSNWGSANETAQSTANGAAREPRRCRYGTSARARHDASADKAKPIALRPLSVARALHCDAGHVGTLARAPGVAHEHFAMLATDAARAVVSATGNVCDTSERRHNGPSRLSERMATQSGVPTSGRAYRCQQSHRRRRWTSRPPSQGSFQRRHIRLPHRLWAT
jgi:hypothetical protein